MTNPQRSSWGVPTVSATGMESESWECKAGVRVDSLKVGDWNVDRGNQEYQANKDNRNIQESYESQGERMRSRPITQVGWRPIQKVRKWAEPLEVEAWLWRDCQEWILKLFEVEIDWVQSGFECGMRIPLESNWVKEWQWFDLVANSEWLLKPIVEQRR